MLNKSNTKIILTISYQTMRYIPIANILVNLDCPLVDILVLVVSLYTVLKRDVIESLLTLLFDTRIFFPHTCLCKGRNLCRKIINMPQLSQQIPVCIDTT